MTRRQFNHGWSYRPKTTAFQELGGAGAEAWTEVALPHDALIGAVRRADVPRGETTGYFPGGAFEYRRTLPVPAEDAGRRYVLEFDGVYRDAMVYVNGALAGQHAYGYSRFTVRIDPFLRFGEDNEVRVECRAHLDSRWYTGAGLHREVHLHVTEPVHFALDGIRITTPDIDDERAVVDIEATVVNGGLTTVTYLVAGAITGPDGTELARGRSPITLPPGESGVVRQRRYVPRPKRWSVEAPHLYAADLRLLDGDRLVEEADLAFGIRSLRLDPEHGLRINGVQVKLRGACVHHDNGPLGAASFAAAEERRVRLLKGAGFNAIRSAHNPASPAMLEACDRLGMLVMDESFDMWTSGKSDFDYAFDFPQWWERDLEAMVAKDFNHPSVVLYSIGNEIPETGTAHGSVWSRRLAEKVRSLDATRFVTNGINGFVSVLDTVIPAMRQRRESAGTDAGGVNGMMAGFGQMMDRIQTSPMVTERTEESFAVLDVAGMNYGEARYASDAEAFPDRIIVGAETWPSVIDRNWELVKAHGRIIGDFTWTGWDYLGESGIGLIQYAGDGEGATSFSSGFPGLTAWCGDLDITGHRRPVSYYRETVFGLRSTPYIAVQRPERYAAEVAVATPWSWSDTVSGWNWPGFAGEPIRVEVYSDAEEVELLLDGRSLGRAKVGAERRFRADFDLRYAPGELTAVAYTRGTETGRASLASAGDDLRLSLESDRTELGNTDLAFVDITLTDNSGVVHHALDRSVTVAVAGPAVLQALGSANPVTDEGFRNDTHLTFDGRALAIVRPTGPGAITVTATAEGCEP